MTSTRQRIGTGLLVAAGLLTLMALLALAWHLFGAVGEFNAFLRGTTDSAANKHHVSTITEQLAGVHHVVLLTGPLVLVLGVAGLALRLWPRNNSPSTTEENPP